MNPSLELFKSFAKKSTIASRKHSNKVVVYTRVSTKEQADNNQSLATQKKYCDAYALKHNLEGVAYDKGKDSYRTPKTNAVFELISCLSNNKAENKKGQTSTITDLSNSVGPPGIEPGTY